MSRAERLVAAARDASHMTSRVPDTTRGTDNQVDARCLRQQYREFEMEVERFLIDQKIISADLDSNLSIADLRNNFISHRRADISTKERKYFSRITKRFLLAKFSDNTNKNGDDSLGIHDDDTRAKNSSTSPALHNFNLTAVLQHDDDGRSEKGPNPLKNHNSTHEMSHFLPEIVSLSDSDDELPNLDWMRCTLVSQNVPSPRSVERRKQTTLQPERATKKQKVAAGVDLGGLEGREPSYSDATVVTCHSCLKRVPRRNILLHETRCRRSSTDTESGPAVVGLIDLSAVESFDDFSVAPCPICNDDYPVMSLNAHANACADAMAL